MADYGAPLLPKTEMLLKHVVAAGIANEESVRAAFRLKKWEGVAVIGALRALKQMGFLENDVHGNYVPTAAGRLRATQKNPPRGGRNRRGAHV